MKPFTGNAYPTLGVEQEFHIIDPETCEMTQKGSEVLREIPSEYRDLSCFELFHSVVELLTPVCQSASEIEDRVRNMRQMLLDACKRAGVRPVSSASHPFSRYQEQKIVETDHYMWVKKETGFISQRLLSFGLHVHVGMASVEGALYAENEFRRWAFPLMALSANSPFFNGVKTGLTSTRAHLFGSMPRSGFAPVFRTYQEVESHYDLLKKAGDVKAPGDLWWAIRIQPPFGTVETRVFDQPISIRRLATLTALNQAAIALFQDNFQKGLPLTKLKNEYLDENRWKAMRYGLNTKLVDPATGEVLEMREQLKRFLELVGPKGETLGSSAYLKEAGAMIEGETEAEWQIKRAEALNGDFRALEAEIADRFVN